MLILFLKVIVSLRKLVVWLVVEKEARKDKILTNIPVRR